MIKKILPICKRLAITYVISLIIGILLLCCVGFLPQAAVMPNVEKSARTLTKEGLHCDLLDLDLGQVFFLDGFTDAIMIIEAASVNKNDILNSVMLSGYRCTQDENMSPIDDLNYIARNGIDNKNEVSYGRYWHGYITVLRPLLCCFSYSFIRVINIIGLSMLALITLLMSYKKIGIEMAVAFGCSLIICIFPVIPLSMQFVSVFYIAFLMSKILMICPKISDNFENVIILFFMSGILTAYFDFLTAPIVTLGFPLLFYCALGKEPNNHIKKIIISFIIWVIGYGGFWASKWIMGVLITGGDFIANSFQQAQMHVTVATTYMDLLSVMYHMLVTNHIKLLLAIYLVLFILFANKKTIKRATWILIIAIIPLCWLLLLSHHTYVHLMFSWRNLIVSITCLLYYLLTTTYFVEKIKFLFSKTR